MSRDTAASKKNNISGAAQRISSTLFYGEYHGHDVFLLEKIFSELVQTRRDAGERVRVVYLAGDSSLDNKYWVPEREDAVNGYDKILAPPVSVPDVAFHVNKQLEMRRQHASTKEAVVCINCSVEESTIGVRKRGKALMRQDVFIRDHITQDDILVVSLGGNDIALAPSPSTVVSMGWLSCCSSKSNIVKGSAWGLGHLRSLFTEDLAEYLTCVTSGQHKPAVVMPCTIYYPDMNKNAPSWAGATLKAIGYNSRPQHVQSIIDRVVLEARAALTPARVGVNTVRVVALSKALDGTNSADYVARVEPSECGGSKMATLLLNEMVECGFLH